MVDSPAILKSCECFFVLVLHLLSLTVDLSLTQLAFKKVTFLKRNVL